MIDEYGADALRLYEMFMGPLEATKPWNTQGVEGITASSTACGGCSSTRTARSSRARRRRRPTLETLRAAAPDDPEGRPRTSRRCKFNTAIAQMMVFVNELTQARAPPARAARAVRAAARAVRAAPRRGAVGAARPRESLAYEPWPDVRPGAGRRGHGRRWRSRSTASCARRSSCRGDGARTRPRARRSRTSDRRYVDGAEIRKVIYVPDKLLNLVVAGKTVATTG